MSSLPDSIQSLFIVAGWTPKQPQLSSQDVSSFSADYVLSEFGGLEVGSCGPGLECTTSNIRFLSNVNEGKNSVTTPWERKLGLLVAVADAHNDHIIVYTDRKGIYYFFTEPDEQLYLGGNSFGEAMERLLLGKAYGPRIDRT